MTFDVNTFKEELATRGYLRPHTFNVQIAIPNGMTGYISGTNSQSPINNISRILSLRAHQCATPSGTLEWVEISRYGIGPQQGYPYNAKFSNIWMSFICDRGGEVYSFFHQWLNKIFPFSPTFNPAGTTPYNSQPSYAVEYKENYASNIAIDLYDQIGNLGLEFILNFAYPLEVREVPLDWGDQGELLELIVVFEYKDYTVSNSSIDSLSSSNPLITSPISTTIPGRTVINS